MFLSGLTMNCHVFIIKEGKTMSSGLVSKCRAKRIRLVIP